MLKKNYNKQGAHFATYDQYLTNSWCSVIKYSLTTDYRLACLRCQIFIPLWVKVKCLVNWPLNKTLI